jgi:hypothetical protein
MLPGSRIAKVAMIAIAIVVALGLVVSTLAAPLAN